jgi:hypothetical protein
LVVVYLAGFYIWALPIQQSEIPYGESDAAIHYSFANHMFTTDKSLVKLPPSTSEWDLHDRLFNQGNYLIYPPQFHTNFAIMQMVNTKPVVGFYIYLAIMCSIVYFTVYLLMRQLYGPIAGLLSAFLMLFSLREQLTYLWGQWGTGITFAFIPAIMYAYYVYTNSVIEKKEKKHYAYIACLLLVFQFLFHPLGFFLCLGILGVYSILIRIKEKKMPFNIKSMGVCLIIFAVLVTAFAPLQMEQILGMLKTDIKPLREATSVNGPNIIGRLFGWYGMPGKRHGIPEFYFSFKNIYHSNWMLLLLLTGITYLLANRKKRDLLILSTLIAFYIVIHLDLVGILLGPKHPRMFYYESIIFYPIIALGVIKITSFVKFKQREIVKYIILGVFVLFVVLNNGMQTYTLFKTAYLGAGRLNPIEVEGMEWINNNIPKGSYLLLVGAYTSKQQHWAQALVPESVIVFKENSVIPLDSEDINKTTHLIMDYTFFYMAGDEEAINILSSWEKNNTREENLLYNYNNQNIYKVFKFE